MKSVYGDFGRWVVVALVALLGSAANAQPTPAKVMTARETVSSFYDSYLQLLEKNRDPFTQDTAFMKQYVAASLLAEIGRRLKSPDGMEEDYFIQAQDYLDEWKGHISVAEVESKGTTAVTVMTLGLKTKGEYRLRVTLRKEAGAWKIVKVQHVGG
jgi:ABC-type transporter MlaC component